MHVKCFDECLAYINAFISICYRYYYHRFDFKIINCLGMIKCTPWRRSCFSMSMTLFRPQGSPGKDSPIFSQVTHGVFCRPVKPWTATGL